MEEKILLPRSVVGKVIGKKDEYIEIDSMTKADLEAFLREVAKFDYKFNRGQDVMTVEAKIDGKSMFVEISESQYKKMCDDFFKRRIEENEKEL